MSSSLSLTGVVYTSCYKLNSGAATSSVVTVSGTYTLPASNSDYTFTSDASCNLDEANGETMTNILTPLLTVWPGAVHPGTGQYSYFMTTGYPWTPIKFAGDQGTANYCSAS